MFVFYLFGTFEISAIKNSLASQPSQVWIDWLTLLLFLSATAKWQFFPLHINYFIGCSYSYLSNFLKVL